MWTDPPLTCVCTCVWTHVASIDIIIKLRTIVNVIFDHLCEKQECPSQCHVPCVRFKKVSTPHMWLVINKLQHVVWTSFYNKLCSDRLHVDKRGLGTRFYRVGVRRKLSEYPAAYEWKSCRTTWICPAIPPIPW